MRADRHSPASPYHANGKMQCNLLYLICINLLLVYERAVYAFTNDTLTTDDLLMFDTTPFDLVDDPTDTPSAVIVTSERPPVTEEPFNG